MLIQGDPLLTRFIPVPYFITSLWRDKMTTTWACVILPSTRPVATWSNVSLKVCMSSIEFHQQIPCLYSLNALAHYHDYRLYCHKNILSMPRQPCCHGMCKILFQFNSFDSRNCGNTLGYPKWGCPKYLVKHSLVPKGQIGPVARFSCLQMRAHFPRSLFKGRPINTLFLINATCDMALQAGRVWKRGVVLSTGGGAIPSAPALKCSLAERSMRDDNCNPASLAMLRDGDHTYTQLISSTECAQLGCAGFYMPGFMLTWPVAWFTGQVAASSSKPAYSLVLVAFKFDYFLSPLVCSLGKL